MLVDETGIESNTLRVMYILFEDNAHFFCAKRGVRLLAASREKHLGTPVVDLCAGCVRNIM